MTKGWHGKVPQELAYYAALSGSAAKVYLVLATHADRITGQCWVSKATMQRATGLSRATVTRAITELVDSGWVKREPRFREGHQTTNLYTLLSRRTGRLRNDTPRGLMGEPQNRPI